MFRLAPRCCLDCRVALLWRHRLRSSEELAVSTVADTVFTFYLIAPRLEHAGHDSLLPRVSAVDWLHSDRFPHLQGSQFSPAGVSLVRGSFPGFQTLLLVDVLLGLEKCF